MFASIDELVTYIIEDTKHRIVVCEDEETLGIFLEGIGCNNDYRYSTAGEYIEEGEAVYFHYDIMCSDGAPFYYDSESHFGNVDEETELIYLRNIISSEGFKPLEKVSLLLFLEEGAQ